MIWSSHKKKKKKKNAMEFCHKVYAIFGVIESLGQLRIFFLIWDGMDTLYHSYMPIKFLDVFYTMDKCVLF